jgi:hypothetical protein
VAKRGGLFLFILELLGNINGNNGLFILITMDFYMLFGVYSGHRIHFRKLKKKCEICASNDGKIEQTGFY